MLQLLKKLKLSTKPGQETVLKSSYQNLVAIICRLPALTKVKQLEHHIELLLHM